VAEKLSRSSHFSQKSVAFVATVSFKPAKLIHDSMDACGDRLGQTVRVRRTWHRHSCLFTLKAKPPRRMKNERSEARREAGGRRPRNISRDHRSECYPLEADAEAGRTRGVRQITKVHALFWKTNPGTLRKQKTLKAAHRKRTQERTQGLGSKVNVSTLELVI
jgi:hypothetical protein